MYLSHSSWDWIIYAYTHTDAVLYLEYCVLNCVSRRAKLPFWRIKSLDSCDENHCYWLFFFSAVPMCVHLPSFCFHLIVTKALILHCSANFYGLLLWRHPPDTHIHTPISIKLNVFSVYAYVFLAVSIYYAAKRDLVRANNLACEPFYCIIKTYQIIENFSHK